jgi:hypothetical protein
MKVTEIITTESLNEVNLLSKLLTKGAQYFSKNDAIDKLAAQWTSELVTYGKILTRQPANVIGKDLAQDKALIKKAFEKVRKEAPGAIRSAKRSIISQGIRKGADNVSGLITKLTTMGVSTASVIQYNRVVNDLQAQLDAGKITPDEFESKRQQAMTVLVGQIAGSLATWGVLKSATVLPVAIIGKFVPGFTAAASGLNAAGMAAAAYWLNTDAGREALTYMLIDGFVDLSPLLGGVPTSWLDKFKAMVPGFNKSANVPAPAGTPQKMGQAPAAAPLGTTKPTMGQQQVVPGTDISTTMTGPNSFDVAYTK